MTSITVVATRRPQGYVYAFQLTGHAGYAADGHDIVCSAISTTITALAEWLVEHPDRAHVEELKLDPGDTRIVCSGDCDDVVEMAVLAFALLEQQFPDNVMLDTTQFASLHDDFPEYS